MPLAAKWRSGSTRRRMFRVAVNSAELSEDVKVGFRMRSFYHKGSAVCGELFSSKARRSIANIADFVGARWPLPASTGKAILARPYEILHG